MNLKRGHLSSGAAWSTTLPVGAIVALPGCNEVVGLERFRIVDADISGLDAGANDAGAPVTDVGCVPVLWRDDAGTWIQSVDPLSQARSEPLSLPADEDATRTGFAPGVATVESTSGVFSLVVRLGLVALDLETEWGLRDIELSRASRARRDVSVAHVSSVARLGVDGNVGRLLAVSSGSSGPTRSSLVRLRCAT
jgi:hypothetical protein